MKMNTAKSQNNLGRLTGQAAITTISIDLEVVCSVLHVCSNKNFYFDLGYPSVCCEYVLLPLVNKEAALSQGKAEYSLVGNPNREA